MKFQAPMSVVTALVLLFPQAAQGAPVPKIGGPCKKVNATQNIGKVW